MSEIPSDEPYENLIVRTLESAGFTNEQAEALAAEFQLIRGDMETVVDQVHHEQDGYVSTEQFTELAELFANFTEMSAEAQKSNTATTEGLATTAENVATLVEMVNALQGRISILEGG